MSEVSRTGPDLSRCFGHYRVQSPQYALDFCVRCSKLKSCVRTAWGVEEPRRLPRRGVGWEGTRPTIPPAPPAQPPAGYYLAT